MLDRCNREIPMPNGSKILSPFSKSGLKTKKAIVFKSRKAKTLMGHNNDSPEMFVNDGSMLFNRKKKKKGKIFHLVNLLLSRKCHPHHDLILILVYFLC